MPINRTPKRAAKAGQPQYNDIYKALESGESEVTQKTDNTPDVANQLADLIKRVDQLSNDNAVLRQQQLQAQHAPQQQQQVFVPAIQQQPQQAQMPDPVLDPQGHAAWLEKRIDTLTKAGIDAYRKSQEDATSSASAYETLWNNFTAIEGNEGWAERPEMVQVAALKVSKKAQAKGLDPQKYMLQNSDMFFKDLKETLEADFGKLDAEDEDGDNEETPGEDEVDRTAGLMGGQAAPINKGKAGQAGNPDMFGDLTAIQRKGGWY